MATDDQFEASAEDERLGEWVVRHLEHESHCWHPVLGRQVVPELLRDYWRTCLATLGGPTGPIQEIRIGHRILNVMDCEQGTIVLDVLTGSVFELAAGTRPSSDFVSHAPQLVGRWSKPYAVGTVGIHAVLLHTNEVLFLSYLDSPDPADSTEGVSHHGEWSVLNLWSRTQTRSEPRNRNQFCGGQCLLGDGTVFLAGGDRAHPLNHKSVSLYHPPSRRWTRLPDLEVGRWYPTVVAIDRNDALLVGGQDAVAHRPEHHVNNPTMQILARGGATRKPIAFDAALTQRGSTYPFVFVLPGGKLFVHFGADSRLLNLTAPDFAAAEAIPAIDDKSRTYPMLGTAVLLPLRPSDTPPYRARIMLMGGATDLNDPRLPARKECEVLDLAEERHRWKPAASMIHGRTMLDAVLLPDGTVLVVNGAGGGGAHNAKQPVLQAEVYDPKTDQWHPLSKMSIERLYHATALLLPDATVLVAGTDRRFNAKPYDYAHDQPEVFSPPYLHWGPRPIIRRAPVEVAYGESFSVQVNDANTIRSAVLIRNGSCTHSFNSDQRFVELEIVGRKIDVEDTWIDMGGAYPVPVPSDYVPRTLRLKAPPDSNVAPRGYYMLFLVSRIGVPSVASFVRLDDSRGILHRLGSGAYSAIRWLSDWASGVIASFLQRSG